MGKKKGGKKAANAVEGGEEEMKNAPEMKGEEKEKVEDRSEEKAVKESSFFSQDSFLSFLNPGYSSGQQSFLSKIFLGLFASCMLLIATAPESKHVYIFSFLAFCLFLSFSWFMKEIQKVKQQQHEEEQKKQSKNKQD
mmetsp:Transcript_40792/g.105837  ORF Transcript_40792/g.105837 Transcript_40792/m.105837 type:complete len:138 (-) Transcript_40792:506-919(-)